MMSETFSQAVDRAIAECDGQGMSAAEAISHIMRAMAQKLDEWHSFPKLIEEDCRNRAMAAQVYPDRWPPKGLGE